MFEASEGELLLVIAGFIIAFLLAFAMGANDCANTFGTSVGSKVLTFKQVCILATIFETLGAVLIGAKVANTMRNGIIDPNEFKGEELELMLGYLSALLGCSIWLLIATVFGLPVSGTHSIVGSTVGMAIVSRGFEVIKWVKIILIVSSWFISPILSGIFSVAIYLLIKKFILTSKTPLNSGLFLLPAIYSITIFINFGGIFQSSPPLLGIDKLSWYWKLVIVFGISVIAYLIVHFMLVPFLRKKLDKNENVEADIEVELENVQIKSNEENLKNETEPQETNKLFSSLQIMTAIFGSFAHGGNDVSNAVGPLIGLYLVYKDNKITNESTTPIWILVYGGIGISIGLCILGKRVIKTVGQDLTKITPSSGFVIELSSAITVLAGSLLGIPISSTHCKIGSVVCTGRVREKGSVDWSLFKNIALAWLVTLPATILISAACQALLKLVYGLKF